MQRTSQVTLGSGGGFCFWIDQAVPMFITITAFLLAPKSCLPTQKIALREEYRKTWERIKRVVFPYIPILMLTYLRTLWLVVFKSQDFSANPIIYLLTGGNGPGAYYVPILVQLYLIFPILRYLFVRNRKVTIAAVLLCDVAFEVLWQWACLPKSLYRLLIFRYFGFIVAGLIIRYSVNQGSFSVRLAVAGVLVGAVYLVLVNYMQFPPITMSSWKNTGWVDALYAGGFLGLAVFFEKRLGGFHISPFLAKVGSSTLYIFFVQIVFYFTIGGYIDGIIYTAMPSFTGVIVECVVNLAICVMAGLCYSNLYGMVEDFAKRYKRA